MDKFWQYFVKYVGVQGIIAVLLTVVIIIIVVNRLTLGSEIYAIYGAVLGYYFGHNGKYFVKQEEQEVSE